MCSTEDKMSLVPSESKGGPTIESLSTKSREAILAITDRILELIPPGVEISAKENSEIERLLNQLTWHLGMWKSYGTPDTVERVQAALELIDMLTAMGGPDHWNRARSLIVDVFQKINGMALIIDRNQLNPLLLRELYGQIEANLRVIRLQFGARAARE